MTSFKNKNRYFLGYDEATMIELLKTEFFNLLSFESNLLIESIGVHKLLKLNLSNQLQCIKIMNNILLVSEDDEFKD
jgi:hypothetical protein